MTSCFREKGFFERNDDDHEEDWTERLVGMQRVGFSQVLGESMRFGFPGAFKNVPVDIGEVTGKVGLFREIPTIVRVNRWTDMIDRDKLPRLQPHYFDRLAIECAAARSTAGRLILYYERIPGDKFMVYDVKFKDLEPVLAEAKLRATRLQSAKDASELPPCPEWMAKFCDYRDRCGCGR